MNKIAIIPVVALASCSLWSKDVVPAVTGAIDCAKAEAAVATKGQSVIQITVEVAESVYTAAEQAASGDVEAAIETIVEKFIVQYGEPVVACVMHDIDPNTPVGSGSSTALSAEPPSIIGQIIAKHGWQFTK